MSTSPASCPGLDFIDGLLTPPESSPEPRRARGAPWASRRPRPYVDKFISPYAAAVPIETADTQDAAFPPPPDDATNYDCPSPPKRRNNKHFGHADASLHVEKISNKQDKLLLKATLPEASGTPLEDAKLPSPEAPQRLKSVHLPRGQPIQRSRNAEYRSWLSTQNIHHTASNTPDLPPVLPVTPPRPVTYSTYHGITTNNTTHTVPFKSVKATYRSARSYTTRNSNRSILRSAAINTFEQITGMTTAARVEAAAAASKSVDSDTESDGIYPRRVEDEEAELPEEIDVFSGGKSKTGDPSEGQKVSSITRQSETRHSTNEDDVCQEQVQGNADHEHHSAPSHWSPEEHVYGHSQAAGRDTVASRQSLKLHKSVGKSPGCVQHKSAPFRPPNCPTAATTSTSLRSRYDTETQSELEEKHEQYKQYVYECILPYSHRRDETLPRKGHKALEMGYLIPPPPVNNNASQASHASDEDSLQELKLRILGRTSQTDFRVLEKVEKKLQEKLPMKEKKTRMKTRVRREERDESDSLAGPASERKKPLSHLNVHSVVNKMKERDLPPPLHEPREQDAKKIVSRPAGTKPKGGKDKRPKKKSKSKKVQLPKGHRPLRLQYEHAKKQPSAARETVENAKQATLGNIAADRTDVPRLSYSPENVASMQLLALEEVHVRVEPRVGRDESPPVNHMQTPDETPRKSAYKTVAGLVELAGPKSLGTRSNEDDILASSQQTLEVTLQRGSNPDPGNELVHTPRPPGPSNEIATRPAVSPCKHAASSRQSQAVVPMVEVQDICDALMPISSPCEQRQLQGCTFTLRTTNATRLAVGTEQQLLASRNFTLQEDLSSLPSDLWHDSENRPEGKKGTSGHQSVPASMVECHDTVEQSKRVLAPDSSRMPYSPAKRGQYTPPQTQTRRPGQASQWDWTPVESASPHKPQARRQGCLFPESSYGSMDGDGSAFQEDSTPPCPTKAILANITPSDQWHLRDNEDDETPSPPSPESDLSPPHSVWSDAIPAPHQECRTPAPSDEYEDKTQVQICSVPPDVEHDYQEALQEQRLQDRPPEIPALAPVPDSPEEKTCDAESTLQTTLNRYGRRVIGFRPLAMRRRPHVNRSIPQATLPHGNLPARPPSQAFT